MSDSPQSTFTKTVTAHFDIPDFRKLAVYKQYQGYEAARKALAMDPGAVTEEVKNSNLVGLGGAGFPAGVKWSFVPKDTPKPKYLVVNGDEGEPGTFKDRYLMELAPHQLLEGMIICCWAVGIHKAYIYVRGEYVKQIRHLNEAIQEAYDDGILGEKVLGFDFKLDIVVHQGAGAYICGEETGLIESLEGKKGWPRIKPPYFPAAIGLFGCPTVINNIETLSQVRHVFLNGAEWYAANSRSAKNGGTRIFCVSGRVAKPGIYELPLGIPLREIIYDHCGGVANGKQVKAVIPGGLSAPILTPDEINVAMDFPSLGAAGSMGGSGGVMVFDEDDSIVELLANCLHFYAHESCGQCTPCREGTGWLAKISHRVWKGEGRPGDIDNMVRIARNMMGNSIGVFAKLNPQFWQPLYDMTPSQSGTICLLADAAAMPTLSYIGKFRDEFDAALQRSAHASARPVETSAAAS